MTNRDFLEWVSDEGGFYSLWRHGVSEPFDDAATGYYWERLCKLFEEVSKVEQSIYDHVYAQEMSEHRVEF